jgi:hypothetical protein
MGLMQPRLDWGGNGQSGDHHAPFRSFRQPRLHIPAGFLHIPAGFLLERFQLKERRSFCEGTLKKSRTDREGTAKNSFLF